MGPGRLRFMARQADGRPPERESSQSMAYERFAVVGLGRFGKVLATQLAARQAEVIAIDTRAELIDEVRDAVTLAIRMDTTDPETVQNQGIDQVDCAIVAIGENFEASCLTVSVFKQLNPEMHVVARATSETRGKILKRIGADEIIFPERDSGERLARALAFPDLLDPDELAPGILEARIKAPAEFEGQSAADLALRQKYDITLVAIQRPTGSPQIVIPQATTKIQRGDTLVLLGNAEQIERLSMLPKSSG